MIKCPKCRAERHVKNGVIKGKQRYKCKECGCNYTRSTLSRTPVEKRIEAIRLYLEGVGFRGIERLTGIPHTTVMSWVKKLGDDIEKFRPQEDKEGKVSIMELDEMWHYVQKKRTNANSG